jgi:hypothetical protein
MKTYMFLIFTTWCIAGGVAPAAALGAEAAPAATNHRRSRKQGAPVVTAPVTTQAEPIAAESVVAVSPALETPVPIVAEVPAPAPSPPTRRELAFAASVFGAYVPAGLAGPGAASAELLELDVVRAREHGDVRFGVIAAHESTYYQSSLAVLLVANTHHYIGSGLYAWGGGVGFGYASLSPKGRYHADNGGTAELASYLVPVLLRLGPQRKFEIALKTGVVAILGFGGEVDPFAGLYAGFVTW